MSGKSESIKMEEDIQKVYLIGNAHLDPVWMWRWQEGFAEIKATFKSALDRMKEFDDFKFTSACACYYQWIEKNAPDMFAEICERVKEGRWEIAGGWYIQPDCNIPSGESFARQGLYSQRYFREKFGKTAQTGYNVDSFGHNGNLPQILKKSGMDYYVFSRPGTHEKDLPRDVFWWESQDGSRVLASRIPYAYCTRGDDIEHINKVYSLAGEQHLNRLCFYGVGNHGGEATIQALNDIHNMQQFKEGNLVFAATTDYFKDISGEDFPVVRDELQYHGRGCYSAYTKIKRDNRRCETAILTAEKMACLTHYMLSDKYPMSKINKAWKDILFNQFHDIICGCSIKAVYEDAAYLHGEAMTIAQEVTNFACQRLSWRIDTLGEKAYTATKGGKNYTMWMQDSIGTPVVLFNPLSWDITVPVQLRTEITGLCDRERNDVVFQIIRAERSNNNDQMDSVFLAKIPAMGYSVYHMFLTGHKKDYENTLTINPHSLENEYIRVTFDEETGMIKEMFDKENNCDICVDSAAGVLMDETNADTWGHDTTEREFYRTSIEKFDREIGRFSNPVFKVMETGPVRVMLQVTTVYGKSELIQKFYLYQGEKKVRVHVRVNFFEKHKMLKLRFGTDLKETSAMAQIPYGFKKIPQNVGEEPCHSWIAMYRESKGFAVINDSKYSCSATDRYLDLTVVRGAIFADHWGDRDESCEYMDQGTHDFKYTIMPYESVTKCTCEGYELNNPPVSIMETFHKGTLPEWLKGCMISEKNVILSAWKRAEDNDGYVLRLYECAGIDTKGVEIQLPIMHKSIRLNFSHNEIKTVKLFDNGETVEANLLEEE